MYETYGTYGEESNFEQFATKINTIVDRSDITSLKRELMLQPNMILSIINRETNMHYYTIVQKQIILKYLKYFYHLYFILHGCRAYNPTHYKR